MPRRKSRKPAISALELFADPLLGAFGAILFCLTVLVIAGGMATTGSQDTGATNVITSTRTIGEQSESVRIHTQTLPPAVAGMAYEIPLVASGGQAPYQWIAITPLPSWLNIDESGVLRGVAPEGADGAQLLKITAIDQNGREASQPLETDVVVAPRSGAPIVELSVLTETLPEAVVGETYRHPIAVRGGVYPLRFFARSLPRGMFIDQNGVLQGIPESAGIFNVDLMAQDSHQPPRIVRRELRLEAREPSF